MNKHLRNLQMEALTLTLNGPDPDKDIDQMYIPNRYVEVYTKVLIANITQDLRKYNMLHGEDLVRFLQRKYTISHKGT